GSEKRKWEGDSAGYSRHVHSLLPRNPAARCRSYHRRARNGAMRRDRHSGIDSMSEGKRGARRPHSSAAAPPVSERVGDRLSGTAATIFLLALTVRLFHLWQLHNSPLVTVLMGDAKAYDGWARQIAQGDWLGHDVFYQAPLYPYFLGILYTL